ncbi:hypothetical protein QR680_007017 [Steinernema hermaphroditum]|uniref:Apple domain-containing protein n=1 Tax=Steinernema hermaphroditum TaxID=289476 RepID=A0AA39HZP7_9BILA|nr:hypothetical protein QR680_007017 [Steinernema hermaphroditum]
MIQCTMSLFHKMVVLLLCMLPCHGSDVLKRTFIKSRTARLKYYESNFRRADSLHHCMLMCMNTNSCRAGSYNNRTGTCYPVYEYNFVYQEYGQPSKEVTNFLMLDETDEMYEDANMCKEHFKKVLKDRVTRFTGRSIQSGRW